MPQAAPAAVTHRAPQQAQVIRLTPAQMLEAADRASALGDRSTALTIYSALEQNPDSDIRNEARFRHARLNLAQGANSKAAILFRRILDEKPEAAAVRLELARTLHLMGDSDSALRELRAAQSGGLPPAVARLVDRYSEALRANRPFGASLELSLAPDSNINRSTRSDTLGTIFGDFDIDQASKAKSGLGLSVRGAAFRRLPLGDSNHSLLGRVSASGDLYEKSSFNDTAVDFTIGPELRLGRNRINIEAGATARWFGQKPFLRSGRAAVRWARPVGRRTQLVLGGSAAIVDNAFNDLQDGTAYSGMASIERALSPVMGASLNLGIDRQDLKDPGYSTTGWRATLVGWRDIGRATLTASATFGKLEADERLVLFPRKRSETYSRIGVGATFRQFGFGGFAPLIRLSRERNRSTIEFYDFRRTRTEFGIVRAF